MKESHFETLVRRLANDLGYRGFFPVRSTLGTSYDMEKPSKAISMQIWQDREQPQIVNVCFVPDGEQVPVKEFKFFWEDQEYDSLKEFVTNADAEAVKDPLVQHVRFERQFN